MTNPICPHMYVIDIVNEFTVKNTNLQYGNLEIVYLNLFKSLDRLQKCLPMINFGTVGIPVVNKFTSGNFCLSTAVL